MTEWENLQTGKYLRWTPSAIDCYNRGCICKGCPMTRLETRCVMKMTVIELVKNLGKPTVKDIIPTKEFIKKLKQGLTLKEIASEFGISLNEVKKRTQDCGISAMNYRGGDLNRGRIKDE